MKKYLPLLITTVVCSVVGYLIFSFVAWDIDFRNWNQLARLAMIGVVFIPYSNHVKKYVTI